jgi:hypothetical protein
VQETGKPIWMVLQTIYTNESIIPNYSSGLKMSSRKFIINNFIFCIHVEEPLPHGDSPIAGNKYCYYEI